MSKLNKTINIKFHILDLILLLGAIMVSSSPFLTKSIISKISKRIIQIRKKLKKTKKYIIHIKKNHISYQKSFRVKILILKSLCFLHTLCTKTKNKLVKMEHLDFKDQWRELKQIKNMILRI